MALFASFGSFCLMAMTDLGGPLRRRFVGTLVITALCAGLIALGTVPAHWIVLAAVGMGIVAFVVRFAGLFGGYAVASGPALTLAFVLAVALPTTDSPLPDRLIGWIAGGVVAALASVLLWPAHERRAISAALASACEAIADLLEELARDSGGSGVGPLADHAHDALAQARARWRSTARRPVGPSIHDRAVVRAIDHTAWTLDLARLFAARSNVGTGDVELLRWNATDLRAAADALRSNAPIAVGTGVALRRERIAALEAEVRAAAGDAAQAPEVAARLERAFRVVGDLLRRALAGRRHRNDARPGRRR